jgi:hypothetical protein
MQRLANSGLFILLLFSQVISILVVMNVIGLSGDSHINVLDGVLSILAKNMRERKALQTVVDEHGLSLIPTVVLHLHEFQLPLFLFHFPERKEGECDDDDESCGCEDDDGGRVFGWWCQLRSIGGATRRSDRGQTRQFIEIANRGCRGSRKKVSGWAAWFDRARADGTRKDRVDGVQPKQAPGKHGLG